ncbi:unnamed protein product [Oppiella nova]|uniref:Uncharacterized protein n=1 Tax=Oppiella nova TaxID=334625 RepID=A0A7R9QVV9_9ACAR|nr:unnamed protein product [Oppiella nova]CAG2177502.1 unnamed protein product [Oppiella nova]
MVTQEDSQSVANELETKIIRQIEYYFSDINLSKDKFLKELIPKDDGWVTFEILLTFKRLNALSGDKEVIVKALRKSSSNLLEISECETKLRRNPEKPLPEINDEYTQELNERTLHLKGFPTDAKLDDIMEFCRQYGTVENIEMRRHMKTKTFKGCIFVVFATKDEAQKVLTADEVKYDGKDLLRENKVTYWARKKEFSERRQRKGGKPVVKDENASGDGKPESVINSVRFAGAVLKLSGLPTDAKFSDIKTLFLKYGPVAYVEAVNAQQEVRYLKFKNCGKKV